MTRTINWGIIGLGKIARRFAEGLRDVPNANLHAVASRDMGKARKFALELGGVKYALGRYEDILKIDELDVVYIATPHAFHFENTMMCLENRLPVLCEKPMAINFKEVGRMIGKARENKVFLMEALWTRFIPSMVKTLEVVRSGRLGKVKQIQADFGFVAEKDPGKRCYNLGLGGGSLLDIGLYPVFLAYSLLGIPDKIKSKSVLYETGVDDMTQTSFEYKNGASAELLSTFRENTKIEARILLERGRITMNRRWHTPTSLIIGELEKEKEEINFHYIGNGYNYEATEVHNCLMRNDIESNFWSMEDSRNLIRLLDEIRRQGGIVYPDHD